ncbi:hypothetical protein Fmac_001635 [Flemingia macrophylla]|uniref:Uncharacterized protein n=1 Tax=Flemingia macrophylla TaxID=520843 RepID=A0ABD1NHP4_9FABA
MGYRPLDTYAAGKSHLPSVESICRICHDNMIPVWNFLVMRAKSEKTVRNIRRNITVHGGDTKEEARGKGGARKTDRALAGEGSEATMREAALQELDFAAKEVERLRNAVKRLRKDLRARMLEVSREEAERKRILDERANYSSHNQPTPSPNVASTSQQPSVPHNNQSIPSPHISLTQTPNIPETPPTLALVDVTSSPVVGSSSSINPCSQIGSVDSDGRIWICPGPQNTFDLPIQPTREISRIIKGKFERSWESYGEVKTQIGNMTKMWFEEFERKFKWLVHQNAQIRRTFDHKAYESKAFSNAMYTVRRGIDVRSWIPKQKHVELEQKWNDENWKEKARTNANNRNSTDGLKLVSLECGILEKCSTFFDWECGLKVLSI